MILNILTKESLFVNLFYNKSRAQPPFLTIPTIKMQPTSSLLKKIPLSCILTSYYKKGVVFMQQQATFDFTTLSDLTKIEKKAKNLVKRKYDFTGKRVVVMTPTYLDRGGEEMYATVYDNDKLSYLSNLRDVLYLQQYLYDNTDVEKVEAVTFEEDIYKAKRKLERIDCIIFAHEFTYFEKEELLFELEVHLDTENVKILKFNDKK